MTKLLRILLVEDDPDIKELAMMALEFDGGFMVRGCDNGRHAVAEALSFTPDLIILDWMMPGFDGGQTLAALKADAGTAGIPVAFMTAKLRTGEVERMRELGAVDVIAKPFDAITLPDLVRNIVQSSR